MPLLAALTWLAPAMLGLGCAMLTVILLRKSWRRHDRSKRHQRDDAPLAPLMQLDTVSRRDRPEVELHELVRDATARIDTKLALLRELVAQSDRRIARLEELLDEVSGRPLPKEADKGMTGG